MNLEAIEQRVLAYLEQVSNPLVRIEVLHSHLAGHDLTENFSLRQLKAFLAKHDLIRVIEPPMQGGAPSPEGEPSGAFAIAKERVPTQDQLSAMMREQLDILLEALRTAREEALHAGDADTLSKIDEAQRRAASLREKLGPVPPDNIVEFRQN